MSFKTLVCINSSVSGTVSNGAVSHSTNTSCVALVEHSISNSKQVTDFDSFNFKNINDAYSNFIQKVIGAIDLVAPKSRRIKQNSQEWFDSEVTEKISICDKLFKKFKKSKLYIDKEIYEIAQYEV